MPQATIMVEFRRYKTEEVGEDDTVVNPRVLINPQFVAAVLENVDSPDKTIIREADGRGFAVRSTYDQAVARLGFDVQRAQSSSDDTEHTPLELN